MERREVHCGSTVARSNIHGLKSRNFLQSLWTELKTYETLNDFEIGVDRQDRIWIGGFLEWKEPAEWRKYAIELWISAWGVWLTPPIRVLFHSFSQPPQSPTMPFKLSATLQAHQDSVRGHFLHRVVFKLTHCTTAQGCGCPFTRSYSFSCSRFNDDCVA